MGKMRKILGIITIVALLAGSVPLMTQPVAAADGEEVILPPIELPEKGNPKLDSQLNQLVSAEIQKQADRFAQQSNIKLVDGRVRVVIECLPSEVDTAIEAAGALGVVETSYRNLLQVVVPIPQLTALADTPAIRFVRLPRYAQLYVISEGAALINADDWQAAGYTGAGIKVAILDGGFTGYADLLGTELPASVTTQSFYAGSDIEGDTDHGTACAEIVYDITPDAQFYLVNFGTDVELGNAVDWLIAQGVDVISFSMGDPIGGPGDGTGLSCEMVDDARTAGILWVSAIGIYAQRHWQGDFVDTESDEWHEFFNGDETNEISVNDGELIIVVLKWDDSWGASANDYDLYLYDSSLSTPVWGSLNIQDGDDDPVEGFGYIATYSGVYHIAIDGYYATATTNFHLYSYYHDLQYQVVSSSFCIPADSPNAMAVGAVPWDNPTTLESFSSQGPTKDNRIKPDLVAPDGVSTATYGATDFYGTSASAPHVAGAAALVKERYPSYTPAEIQTFLEGRAVDLGAVGKDNLYGSGRLDLGSLGTIEVTVVSIVPNSGNQGQTLNVTITGTNFTGATGVSFGAGITVNSFTVDSDTQITANISIAVDALVDTRNVSVTAPEGTGTLTDGFTVTVPGGQTLVSINAPDRVREDSDFTATVDIGEVVDLNAAQYDVSFDNTVLRLDDITSGQIDGTEIPLMSTEISPGTWRVVQTLLLETVSGSGNLSVLHFYVIGSTGESSAIDLSDGMLSGMEAEIPATWTGDLVEVVPPVEPGDANGDGVINVLDITKVVRIILALDAETLGSDANEDGEVNVLDITKIVRIILMLD